MTACNSPSSGATDDLGVPDDAGRPVDAAPDAPYDFPDVGPPPGDSPTEPPWPGSGLAARVKSPAQGMSFSPGLPIRLLADVNDPEAWQCPPGHPPYVCADSFVDFFVDGIAVGRVNLHRLRPSVSSLSSRLRPESYAASDGGAPTERPNELPEAPRVADVATRGPADGTAGPLARTPRDTVLAW